MRNGCNDSNGYYRSDFSLSQATASLLNKYHNSRNVSTSTSDIFPRFLSTMARPSKWGRRAALQLHQVRPGEGRKVHSLDICTAEGKIHTGVDYISTELSTNELLVDSPLTLPLHPFHPTDHHWSELQTLLRRDNGTVKSHPPNFLCLYV